MSIFKIAGVASAALLVAGCAVNFNDLVAEIDQAGISDKTTVCAPNTKTNRRDLGADISRDADADAQYQAAAFQQLLPRDLADDPVLRAVQGQVLYMKAATTHLNQTLKVSATMPAAVALSQAPATPAPRPATNLTQDDFARLLLKIAKYVLRGTTSAADSNDPGTTLFKSALAQYYYAFYKGNFVTYFGKSLNAPQISATVTDDEINQAATVLLELIFDASLHTPVWTSKDKKTFYPGGTGNQPTGTKIVLSGTNQSILPQVPLATTDCDGINMDKADAINFVAQRFAAAAVAGTSLTVKSAGGISIGFGILGKLSVGDNTTLTSLIQTVVSEAVQRLSAHLAYEILERLNFSGSPNATARPMLALAAVGPKTPRNGMKVHEMSSIFVGAN